MRLFIAAFVLTFFVEFIIYKWRQWWKANEEQFMRFPYRNTPQCCYTDANEVYDKYFRWIVAPLTHKWRPLHPIWSWSLGGLSPFHILRQKCLKIEKQCSKCGANFHKWYCTSRWA